MRVSRKEHKKANTDIHNILQTATNDERHRDQGNMQVDNQPLKSGGSIPWSFPSRRISLNACVTQRTQEGQRRYS